jgi:hypothetical protein
LSINTSEHISKLGKNEAVPGVLILSPLLPPPLPFSFRVIFFLTSFKIQIQPPIYLYPEDKLAHRAALAASTRLMASLQDYTLRQRRFAPLNPSVTNTDAESSNAPPLKGIVFDVDGTLWFVLSLKPSTVTKTDQLF